MVLRGQEPIGSDPERQVISAEQPPIELARQWIADSRPVYRAWAAELIRRHELEYLSQELIGALGDVSQLDPHSASESDEDKMRLGILDALIQLHVEVPESVGQALFSRYPVQALILLYGNGCPNVKVGTHILDNCESDECWLVAAQCLAGDSGGPVELLQRLQIKAEVRVHDPDRGEGCSPGPGRGGIPGRVGWAVPHAGWPELYTYYLTARWNVWLGNTLLAGGKYPVYYVREPGGGSERLVLEDRNEYILEILAERLGTKRESLGLATHPSVQLHWTTAERYRSDLRAFVANQQRKYAELVSLLLRHRGLTPEESKRCHLNLDIEVIDRRSDRRQSIPNVGVGDHLELE
jgi:hypothetical protein